MKCPNCLGRDELQPIPSRIAWYLWPLKVCLATVRCDTCLTIFFRVRVLGILFRRRRLRELPHIES